MSEPVNEPGRQQPVVENRAVKPSGILPKNTQAIVIAGISVIMVGAIALSGNSSSKSAPKPAVSPNSNVVDPNQARIAEYRQRLDEQARKLAAEQAQVIEAKQQFGATTGIQPGTTAPYPNGTYPAPQAANEENSIESDRKRRVYLSLFASNVALSFRKDAQAASSPSSQSATRVPGASAGEVGSPPIAPIPTANGYLVPFAPSALQTAIPNADFRPPAADVNSDAQPQEKEDTVSATKGNKDQFAGLNQSQGKNYRLFEGTVVETVLTNRLTGSFAGPVNCMVTTNVYSHDRQHLLIPQGSRALGEVKRVSNFGQERVAVVFHRLIMPDGYSVSLDQFKGLNQIGETGLRDQVNHHYAEVFGVSLAIGAIAGLAQADTASGIYQSSTGAYRQGVAGSLSQSSLHILDRYLNVLPTFTIREGHRVKVYLSDDLLLPVYENHHMPEDL